MSYKKINKPSKEELAKLLKIKTNLETSKILMVNTRTIQRWRDFYGLSQEIIATNGNDTFSKFQNDVIIGLMLGDGCVSWCKQSQNNTFSFQQKKDRHNYVQFVYDTLLPFSSGKVIESKVKGPIRLKNGKIIQNRGKLCYSSSMYTCAAKLFKQMRQEWYSNPYQKKSQKIIPNIILNWTIFSYWFADDGNNNPAKKTISLATQSFTNEDVDKILSFIKRDLNIEGNRKNYDKSGPIITFGVKYYDLILKKLNENLNHLQCLNNKLSTLYEHNYQNYKTKLTTEQIKQLWIDKLNLIKPKELCEKYKISKATLFRIIKKYSLDYNEAFPSGRKLKLECILNITKLWNEGYTQKTIAEIYNVTQTLISAIVRRKSHVSITKNCYIKGEESKDFAIVSVVYNPNL